MRTAARRGVLQACSRGDPTRGSPGDVIEPARPRACDPCPGPRSCSVSGRSGGQASRAPLVRMQAKLCARAGFGTRGICRCCTLAGGARGARLGACRRHGHDDGGVTQELKKPRLDCQWCWC